MKKIYVLFLLLIAIFLYGNPLYASPSYVVDEDGNVIKNTIDGKIDEWASSSVQSVQPEAYVFKDGLPWWHGGEDYDVEKLGLYIDDRYMYIALQTDFDIADLGSGAGGESSGDFIFDFNDDNTYEFALDFSINDGDDTIDFTLYDNTYADSPIAWDSTTSFQNGTVVNKIGAPWQAHSGTGRSTSNLVGNGTVVKSAYFDPWDNDGGYKYCDGLDTDEHEGHRIELAVDLDKLTGGLADLFANNSELSMHWQMSCGNDYLEVVEKYTYTPSGGTSPTPEPQTFLMFGVGLIAFSFYGRRRLEEMKDIDDKKKSM